LAGRGQCRSYDLAQADHRDGVGDGLHLAQLVGDEHYRRAGVAQLADDVEQLIRFLRGKHCRRLIENEDVRVTRQRLDDLDTLLRAHRQVFDHCVGIHVEPKAIGNLEHPAPRRVDVEQTIGRQLLVSEHDVLRHGEGMNQHEVLVHHADSRAHGVSRADEVHDFVVHQDLSAIGVIQPEQYIHKRRLTRTVFAQQGMHRAWFDREVDPVVRYEVTELLGDPSQLEFHVETLL